MEVYVNINRVNGKAYVGHTWLDASRRFKRHCRDAAQSSQCAFHRAIRKYGAGAFSVNTVWRGYSLDDAGKSWRLSDETRQRMRAAQALRREAEKRTA